MELEFHAKNFIFERLLPDVISLSLGEEILSLLNRIWPLRDMPSEDGRFANAYEDACQHLINNDDWSLEFTFLDRFKLLQDDAAFKAFLEVIVSPEFAKTLSIITQIKNKLNLLIQPYNLKLVTVDYFEELPVNKLRPFEHWSDLPNSIKANDVVFYKIEPRRDQYPCFKLQWGKWNDYGSLNQVFVSYVQKSGSEIRIGEVKIMFEGREECWSEIPDSFLDLVGRCCSVGQSKNYYNNLRDLFPQSYQSVLYAIRDASFFPRISEKYETSEQFRDSLIRYNSAEEVWRTVRYIHAGQDVSQQYKFTFRSNLPYSGTPISIDFDFEYGGDIEHRIYAIIGKNGAGKTRILNALAAQLSDEGAVSFIPKKPLFGKVLSVSYSLFDNGPIPQSDAVFNYVYCGMKTSTGAIMTKEELYERFQESIQHIRRKKLITEWRDILQHFIPASVVDQLYGRTALVGVDFREEEYFKIKDSFSSGQAVLFYVVAELIAHLRQNSLILFDEPETHLHPNAITDLMNALQNLVSDFNSFCIIATHSPLIVQELPSSNVVIIERDEDLAIVKKLEKNSFAENLTVITDEIFGNRDSRRKYLEDLRIAIRNGASYESIVSALTTDSLPLSLAARLFLRSLQDQK